MSWTSDYYDEGLELTEEELQADKAAAEARLRGDPATTATGKQRARSTADDILDAVADTPPPRVTPPGCCAVCGSPAKRRAPGVGNGTIMMKCTNKKCLQTWPVGQRINRVEVPPPPPVHSTGPYEGEGGPEIDRNQPINRRLAEHIRRARDHEP